MFDSVDGELGHHLESHRKAFDLHKACAVMLSDARRDTHERAHATTSASAPTCLAELA